MERGTWVLIVCLGFIGAGVLIARSVMEWHDSPISTSISTKPLEELEFPGVTICPKRGSHTALNPDLVRAGNKSLPKELRTKLQKAAFDIFKNLTYQKHIEKMMGLVGTDIIRDMLDGFSGIPEPIGENGLRIRIWKNEGSFRTPGFKGVYQEGYYDESKH